MLTATVLSVLLVPALYVIITRLSERFDSGSRPDAAKGEQA
jgi:hypothetical protein